LQSIITNIELIFIYKKRNARLHYFSTNGTGTRAMLGLVLMFYLEPDLQETMT